MIKYYKNFNFNLTNTKKSIKLQNIFLKCSLIKEVIDLEKLKG